MSDRGIRMDEAELARHITAHWGEVKRAVEIGSPLTLAKALLSEPQEPQRDQCSKCVKSGPYAGQRCMLRVGHTGMCA